MAIHYVQHSLSLLAARLLCDHAVAEAEQVGIQVNVAVTDQSGVLLAFVRMPGAFIHSINIAIDKAYTSAGFRLSTSDLEQVLEQSGEPVRAGLREQERLIAFGGGIPIIQDGYCLGAVGVSGGSAAQDIQCAEAGIKAVLTR